MKIHNDLELEILHRYNINMDRNLLRTTCAGVPFQLTMKKLFAQHNVKDADPEKLVEEKRKKMLKIIETDLKPIPGVINLLNMLKKDGRKMAIGTSSHHRFVDKAMNILGVKDFFECVVCVEDVNNKAKPAPDIFLKCAELLNLKPQDCIVVEDGVKGIIAANKANMKSIAYTYGQKKEDFPSKFCVDDLKKLSLEDFN